MLPGDIELDHNRIVNTTVVQSLVGEGAIDRRIEIAVWHDASLVEVAIVLHDLDDGTG